jgi:hypothetical protein
VADTLDSPSNLGIFARLRKQEVYAKWTLLIVAIFLAHLAFAQGRAKVTSVDPTSGKVNDSLTLMGENLDKESVIAVYLSDDTTDYQATVVDQSADKIVVKVPKVKSGNYNVSIKVGEQILILPLRYAVQE